MRSKKKREIYNEPDRDCFICEHFDFKKVKCKKEECSFVKWDNGCKKSDDGEQEPPLEKVGKISNFFS